jgi:SPP1 gp7 family putative phage head morphogenesis protein
MAQPALTDATLRHAVFTERLKSGEAAKFAPFLKEIDRNLRERLTRGGLTAFQRDRLESMLTEIDGMLASVLSRFAGEFTDSMKDYAAYETARTVRLLDDMGLAVAAPAAELVWAAVATSPLGAANGALLAPFVKNWTDAERQAITGAIRLGVAQGQTVAQLVQTIRGTKAANYADGLLAITKRHAEAVVRTSVAHVGATARQATYDENADIFSGLQWDATLDHRTCIRCQALDGRKFKMGEGPVEPLHVQCRCVRVPVLADEFDYLTEGEKRSSKDGPVDGRMTYYDWLKGQPATFQNEVLGKSRAELFRNGGLTAEQFAALQLDRNFKAITLEEMKRLDPLLFTSSKPLRG